MSNQQCTISSTVNVPCYPPQATATYVDIPAYDPSSGSRNIVLLDCPLAGTLSEAVMGSLRYSPCANFSGTDSLSFVIDGDPKGTVQCITIVVGASNSTCGHREVTRCAGQSGRTWMPSDEVKGMSTNSIIVSDTNECFKPVLCNGEWFDTCPQIGAEMRSAVDSAISCDQKGKCVPDCCSPGGYYYSVKTAVAEGSWSLDAILDWFTGQPMFDPVIDRIMFSGSAECPMVACIDNTTSNVASFVGGFRSITNPADPTKIIPTIPPGTPTMTQNGVLYYFGASLLYALNAPFGGYDWTFSFSYSTVQRSGGIDRIVYPLSFYSVPYSLGFSFACYGLSWDGYNMPPTQLILSPSCTGYPIYGVSSKVSMQIIKNHCQFFH